MSPFPSLTLPSYAIPNLVWRGERANETEDYIWSAEWEGQIYDDPDTLRNVLSERLSLSDAIRFEIWTGYLLGMDAFKPVIDPNQWQELLTRGPVIEGTDESDGVPVDPSFILSPHTGEFGLEGLIIHEATGHVFKTLTAGHPLLYTTNDGRLLPILVVLTKESDNSDEKAA